MLFPRKLGLAVCAVAGMTIGGATVALAGPATGLGQAAAAIESTSAPLAETPRVQQAAWHRHWHHHWHHRHWHRWHHWHHRHWHHHW